MGCGSSKGVVPTSTPSDADPAPKQGAPAPVVPDADTDHHQQKRSPPEESGAQHPQVPSLPGRTESTTAPAPEPSLKELSDIEEPRPSVSGWLTAKSADEEFNYDKELQRGAAIGLSTPLGNTSVGTAHGAVVGGLLSKQPDWLRGTTVEPTSTDKAAHGPSAAKGSVLPPLSSRGEPARSSLPPLAPVSARGLTAREPEQLQQSHQGSTDGHGVVTSAAADQGLRASIEGQAHGDDMATHTNGSSSSRSRSHTSSFNHQHIGAEKSVVAATHDALPAEDPWRSLQSQYAAAGDAASRDGSLTGSAQATGKDPIELGTASIPTHLQHPMSDGHDAALPPLATQGSRKGSGAATAAHVGSQQYEMVLANSDDEAPEEEEQLPTAAQHRDHRHTGDAELRSSIGDIGSGKLSARSSQHSVSSGVPSVAKSGGWGVGTLAGAGTIMLGDEASSQSSARKPGKGHAVIGAPAHGIDDVFGDDEAPTVPSGVGDAASALTREISRIDSSRRRVGPPVPPAAARSEALDVEEIEDDVDAMFESGIGGDGLPADLTAKLAQFEAMAADADSDAGGSAGDADGTSVYAMMNNRQGSWRTS